MTPLTGDAEDFYRLSDNADPHSRLRIGANRRRAPIELEGWAGRDWAELSMPLRYLPLKAVFATVSRDGENNARLIGASIFQVPWRNHLALGG